MQLTVNTHCCYDTYSYIIVPGFALAVAIYVIIYCCDVLRSARQLLPLLLLLLLPCLTAYRYNSSSPPLSPPPSPLPAGVIRLSFGR